MIDITTIHTNKRHPFLTVEKGFLPVGQITLGMHIVEANGQTGIVSGWKVVPGVMTMYNLEVALDHTFVVGMEIWVVHNCDGGFKVGISPDEIRNINSSRNTYGT
jgi:Pretoxin HINT domain